VILVIWAAASALSYYPHFISYFNEFVPDRKLAYRHLADSNLDWHGNDWYLAEYIRRHPGVIIDPRNRRQVGLLGLSTPWLELIEPRGVQMVERAFYSGGSYCLLIFDL
jgi:hypothetical protein